MSDDGTVVLGRAGTATGWLLAVAFGVVIGAIVVAGVAGVLPIAVAVQVCLPFCAAGGILVWLLTRRGSDVVVVTDDHISVHGRAGRRQWRWDEVIEVGTAAASGQLPYLAPGLTVVIRPEGRAYAKPGPNMPQAVALAVFGRAARARVIDTLKRACDEHGVPFTEDGLRMADQPRPRSPFRVDRSRHDPT